MLDLRRTAPVTALLLATMVVTAASAQSRRAPARADEDTVNARWLEKLPRADRAELEVLVGYAPPPIREEVTWIGANRAPWKEFVGKVVIVQSWSCKSSKGRRMATTLDRLLERLDESLPRADIKIIMLHTPEGADELQKRLERTPTAHTILVDSTGAFCDDLGIYTQPVNLLIDRSGAVRYVGLNQRGLREALPKLLAEPFTVAAKPRPEPEKPSVVAFPEPRGSVSGAKDVRGQRGPEFHVAEWMTPTPNAHGKVVMIDFWATWCGPCRKSIPHVNDLAQRFRDDLVIVGLSNERESDFERGLDKYNLEPRNFSYSLALDPKSKMSRTIGITGIPHGLVLDSNWVVRWQGHPARLTAETMRQIVEADRALRGASGSSDARRRRWTSAKKTR